MPKRIQLRRTRGWRKPVGSDQLDYNAIARAALEAARRAR